MSQHVDRTFYGLSEMGLLAIRAFIVRDSRVAFWCESVKARNTLPHATLRGLSQIEFLQFHRVVGTLQSARQTSEDSGMGTSGANACSHQAIGLCVACSSIPNRLLDPVAMLTSNIPPGASTRLVSETAIGTSAGTMCSNTSEDTMASNVMFFHGIFKIEPLTRQGGSLQPRARPRVRARRTARGDTSSP